MIYPINKAINKSIVFRGLKGQYIWYAGGAMFADLILYALMYVCGMNTYVSLLIAILAAAASIMVIYQLSETFGEHGLTKALAKRKIPRLVKATSRKRFFSNLQNGHQWKNY